MAPQRSNPDRARLAAAVLLALIVTLILVSGPVHRGVLRGLAEAERVAASQPAYAMILVVVFSAVAAMLAFVSSWVLVPFAVFTWGPALALLLLWSGWLLGGAASYAIGRYLGGPAVRRLVPAPLLERYELRFSSRMPFRLVLLGQMALPSEIPGYLLGIVRYPFTRYLAALGLVEIVYGVVTVYLGASLLERRVGPLLGGLAVLALLTMWAARRVKRRIVSPPTGDHGGPATLTPSATRSLG